MTEQEINIERQRKNIIEKEKQMRRGNKTETDTFQNKQYAPVNMNQQINTPPISQNKPSQAGSIKAPMNVQDILSRLHNSENNNSTDTQEESSSNNDRLVASSSLNSSEKRKGRKKKSIMTIS